MTDHKRGELEIRQFSEAIVESLNNEQNGGKDYWLFEEYRTLRRGLIEEAQEAWQEAKDMEDYEDERRHQALRDLMAECQDVAASAMFLWDKARHELREAQ